MRNICKIILITVVLALTACAVNDPYRHTTVGAGIGAVTGAVIGHQLDHDVGRYVGAAVGALAGGAVGNYMDRQQQALDQALAAERAQGLEIQRLQDGSIKLDIPSEILFDFDSAAIKPAFESSLNQVADILRQYDRTVVHIIGHTDSIGSDAYNMNLSQRRANSVADYLVAQGVSPQRLRTEGRGEREPLASNATAAGRQLNRRVEMIIQPVVEGQEQRAYQTPGGGYGTPPPPPAGTYPGGGYGTPPPPPAGTYPGGGYGTPPPPPAGTYPGEGYGTPPVSPYPEGGAY